MQIKMDSLKKINLLILVTIFLLISVFNVSVNALSNQAQISFKTADVITVNGNAYVFAGWYTAGGIKTDTNDKVRRAYKKDDSCSDFIAINKNNSEVRLIKASQSNTSANKSCSFSSWEESEKLNNITDNANRFIIYYWQDKDTIVRLANGFNGTEIGGVSYTREGNSNKFIENTGGNCKDEININSPTNASYIARSSTNEKQLISWNSDGSEVKEQANKQVAGCFETNSVGIKLGYSENSDKKPEDATAVPGSGDTGTGYGDDAAQEANCSQALSPFGWVLCPSLNFADNLYDLFKKLVNNLLFFEADKYQDNGLYSSWKIMVTLANTVLVLVAIVMIAAQIFNFDFISAYTVKKALPRIVIAAILIQLSWFMVTTGIQIVNAIGSGLYWLLVAPFAAQLGSNSSDGILEIGSIVSQGNGEGNTAVFGSALLITGSIAVGAALSGLWVTLVFAAIGVIISLAVALVTLIIREVLLVVLIAIAPLAIAMWILPGTNGLWNMWWKTFSRLLLMYPLVMMLFAGGTIAAFLLASAGGGINLLFAIIAFFVPVFMVGATFKFAGGAFASIANMTGKLGSSLRGRTNKFGAEQQKNYRAWQASNYEQNAKGFGKLKNASARLAAGGMPIGNKSKLRTAQVQASYFKEKNEMADYLASAQYEGIKGEGDTYEERVADQFKKQGEFLKKEAKKGGDAGHAAMRLMVATKRMDLFNELLTEPGGGSDAFREYQSTSTSFSSSIAQAGRSDLLDTSDKKVMQSGAKEALSFDKSFWLDENSARRDKLGSNTPGGRQRVLEDLGQYENWRQLDQAGKKYVETQLRQFNPGWTPPQSPIQSRPQPTTQPPTPPAGGNP